MSGECWYCCWGWPKPVADVYLHYEALIGGHALKYGPGHIVWEDENFGDSSILWCIEQRDNPLYRDDDQAELDLIVESLRALLTIDEAVRVPEGVGADDVAAFPPKCPCVKI
jgi:hypothetical protein